VLEYATASEKVKRSKRDSGVPLVDLEWSGLGLLREISRTPGRLRGVEVEEGLGGLSEELLLEWDI
jgi:hypothetical protein